MKTYQDTETGQLHAFDDGVDPFKLNNRNIPTTLSETVIPKPSESHVWYKGDWVKDTDVPKGYKPPVSSVPAYNPAWVSFLFPPYTVVLPDAEGVFGISFEQAISKFYDNEKLSEAVTTLPLSNTKNIPALISYDGAIAIPRNADYPSIEIAIESINRILCATLLGGIHVEAIDSRGLVCGSLESGTNIFVNNPTFHSRLRSKDASVQELFATLMHPRIVRVSELNNAYLHGIKVLDGINNFSPIFLLRGYSALLYQNWNDALSNLWIVVEQLTWHVWENQFLSAANLHPNSMKTRLKSLKDDNRTWSISVKHELLWQTKFISEECYVALSLARQSRNDLVHKGRIPDFTTIEKLWKSIFELLESASGIASLGMRQLITFIETPTAKLVFPLHSPVEYPELGFPEKNNFDEWLELSKKLCA